MCGIVGIWGNEDENAVRSMMDKLVHRGPDADGLYNGPKGTLGHRRLSIMDPNGGNQPIFDESGKMVIVANGEIYNFPVLKKRLEKNHRFRTRSDTESVLHLYKELHSMTAASLDGMFAFAIADGQDIFMARDPIGIKPLYYGKKGKAMVFASELKAICGQADEIKEFPPGTWFHSALGFNSYYDVPDIEPIEKPVADYLADLRSTLERAVCKRLMSDVPVGAFLSGGLDSSLIVAIARQHLDQMHTFSVGIEGSRDLEAARIVARHLDTIHHEYTFTIAEVMQKLPQIIYSLESFDQDLVRSAIPCFFASRLAAQHVKVILTGEGADELFAGYTYYKDMSLTESLHQELRRSVSSLHNINLQRVDRLTMAHSIEGRVPFLDVEMIETALSIPSRYKLYRNDKGALVEKWILREACKDLLPHEIVWRDKEQFDEGSGTTDLLDRAIREAMPEDQALKYKRAYPKTLIRSDEECYYHQLFMEVFENPDLILANVARWAERDFN